MRTITLAIDDGVLEQVRGYAARSENAMEAARDRLLKLIDESQGRSGEGWKWSREESYEGRVLPRHQRSPLCRPRKR